MSISGRQIFPVCRSRMGILVVIFLLSLSGCRQSLAHAPRHGCDRIVSLSPSITEVLYALDLGPNVVGVTRYCRYPADARTKPKVGGYVDPDAEALIRLQPDWVMVREEQTQLRHQLTGLGFRLLPVDHRNAPGILNSIRQIGKTCQREPEANALIQSLQTQIAQVTERVKTTRQRPKVLVVIDRDVQSDRLHWAFVAGQDGFYDWMITQAGGQNAVPAERKGFLQISPEGILKLNPDVILETTASIGPDQTGDASIKMNGIRPVSDRTWQALQRVSAVKAHRVYHLTADYMVIPGPRFVSILRRFAQAIHPELDWSYEPPATAASR